MIDHVALVSRVAGHLLTKQPHKEENDDAKDDKNKGRKVDKDYDEEIQGLLDLILTGDDSPIVKWLRELYESRFVLADYNKMRKEKGQSAPLEEIGNKKWGELDETHKLSLAYYFRALGDLFKDDQMRGRSTPSGATPGDTPKE